jgi:hypothetical protein
MGLGGVACPKPEPRKRTKARKVRVSRAAVRDVRAYVFARERDICRICRKRPATSMHELQFRSCGGRVSKRNSVAACGDGSPAVTASRSGTRSRGTTTASARRARWSLSRQRIARRTGCRSSSGPN